MLGVEKKLADGTPVDRIVATSSLISSNVFSSRAIANLKAEAKYLFTSLTE